MAIARSGAAKACLGAVTAYDDVLVVATLSTAGHDGGIDKIFVDDEKWNGTKQIVEDCRKKLATANLMQVMFNNILADQRVEKVKTALTKAPKQGELAIPKGISGMAKAMISLSSHKCR